MDNKQQQQQWREEKKNSINVVYIFQYDLTLWVCVYFRYDVFCGALILCCCRCCVWMSRSQVFNWNRFVYGKKLNVSNKCAAVVCAVFQLCPPRVSETETIISMNNTHSHRYNTRYTQTRNKQAHAFVTIFEHESDVEVTLLNDSSIEWRLIGIGYIWQ